MTTLGTGNKEGVRISYSIDFNGVSERFKSQEIISVSDLSNSGDTINNRRKISDLSFSLYDGSGTIWSEIGDGTTAFGMPVSLTVSVGGTYSYNEAPNGTSLKFTGTKGSDDFTVHTGSIVSVRRSKKLLTFRSENKLNKIKDLNWQLPVQKTTTWIVNTHYGSYVFLESLPSQRVWEGTFLPNCLYDVNEDRNGGIMWGHFTNGSDPVTSYPSTGTYDTSGVGITDFLDSNYMFANTTYHSNYPPKKVKGTLLGTLYGTIDSSNKARAMGYNSLDQADANNDAQNPGQDTGTYVINRVRFESESDFDRNVEVSLNESQLLRIEGDPTAVIRHCLVGKMVSDFFDYSTDIGNTFAQTQTSVAFQVFDQTFHPGSPKPSKALDDAFQMTSSIFFASTENKFELYGYKPYDLSQTLDSIGTDQMLSSSYDNNINDYYNRVILNYSYNFSTEKYSRQSIRTGDNWGVNNDKTLEVKSTWIKSDNQAEFFTEKLIQRVKNTVPELTVKTTMESAGRDLGSLISITDPDTFTGTKIIQLLEYNKGFGGDKTIKFRALDGEALYRQAGYGRWEDASTGAAVTGTSKGGWSDGAGNVSGINTSLYGDFFKYW